MTDKRNGKKKLAPITYISGLVYVAHRMAGPEVQYLAHVAKMAQVTRRLYEGGYSPYNPAGDILVGLSSPTPLPVAHYKRVSMAWLYVSEVLLVVGDISTGVRDEITEAEACDIPVVFMDEWEDPVDVLEQQGFALVPDA